MMENQRAVEKKKWENRMKWVDQIRSIDDPQQLREFLREVEAQIKAIVGENPFEFYTGHPSEGQIDQVEDLLGDRRVVLDQSFACTSGEVAQIERLNNLLLSLTQKMFHRTADLCRWVLGTGRDSAFDDDYEAEGSFDIEVYYDPDEKALDSVITREDDEHYGSDFPYMLYVIHENEQASRRYLDKIHSCIVSPSTACRPDATDEELGCDYTFLDDGVSWNECLRYPEFEHICFCYAFHSFHTHHCYSLQDMIRVNDFWVEAQLVCQHNVDQRGRRLPRFKTAE